MSGSIKLLNTVGKVHPVVLPHPINRHARLWKIRVCEGPDRNGYYPWNGIQPIEDRGTALRAKVEPGRAALLADAHILPALALDGHRVSRKSGLSAKYATGTLLARQAMADRDAKRLAACANDELPATT